MNRVVLMGRLTADPEIKMTPSNKQILRFALAVQRNKDTTDFFDCVAWDATATLISRLATKGSRIIVDGRLETGYWTDKDGKKHKDVYVVCTEFTAVDFKPKDDAKPSAPVLEELGDEELPF